RRSKDMPKMVNKLCSSSARASLAYRRSGNGVSCLNRFASNRWLPDGMHESTKRKQSMKKNAVTRCLAILAAAGFFCGGASAQQASRIVSLGGTVTEIIYDLQMQHKL